METLLTLAVALMAGLLLTRLIKRWRLPAVTAYLVAGVLIGPNCLGLLGIRGLGFPTFDDVEQFGLISDVALGFIAFAIGNEFRLAQLRKTGKQAAVVAVIQALTATVFVDVVLLLLHLVLGDRLPVSTCIVLGAVATATAPAATIMVVNQYKAKGPLTDILLPIVALDDAVGLVVFAISFGAAKTMTSGSFSPLSVILNPTLEIVASLLLGAALGGLFSLVEKLFHSNSKRLSVAVAFVVLAAALSKVEIPLGGEVALSFSSLLVCMMVGSIFCNVCDFSQEIMYKTDRWTAPLYVLFFVLSAGVQPGGGCGRWPGLYPLPFCRKDYRGVRRRQTDALPADGLQVFGPDLAAPGGRGPGHVRHCGSRLGGAREDYSGYYSILSAGL